MARVCQTCGALDAPVLEYDFQCRGRSCSPIADENIATHADTCTSMIHEVRTYPKLVQKRELIYTNPKMPNGDMLPKWYRAGWKLRSDGGNLFRYKMLCRSCIEIEAQRERNHQDYLNACERLRNGQKSLGYYEILDQ